MRSPFLDSDRIYPPLGILYLKSYLNEHGFEVGLEDEFDYDHPEKYEHYDAFGASVMTPQREEALKFLHFCKEHFPGKPVVIGGPHAKHYLDETTKEQWDYIVPWDGQRSLLKIMQGKGQRIETDFIDKATWANISRPDRTSPEAISMLSKYNYVLGGRRSTTLFCATGCPEKCHFCFTGDTKVLTGKGYKAISEIAIGESVLTFNEKTSSVEMGKVKKVFVREVQTYLKIRLANGKTIKVTEEHPFYLKGKWVAAKDLQRGDILHKIGMADKMQFANPMKNSAIAKKAGKTRRRMIEEGTHVPYLSTAAGRKMVSERQKVVAVENNPMRNPEVSSRANSAENYQKRRESGFGVVKKKFNASEEKFSKLLAQQGSDFSFVGDKPMLVAGYNPDFIHPTKKKIIELFGCYWHNCPKCKRIKQRNGRNKNIGKVDPTRIAAFQKEGYETLVVWEHELKDPASLVRKVFDFETNGIRVVSVTKATKRVNVYNFECDNNTYFAEGVLVHNCEDAQTAVRWSGIENLEMQLDEIVALGYSGVYIFDDLFAIALPKVKPIAAALKKRGLIYRCNAQARYFTMWGEEFARLLAETGCFEIAFGAESGSQKILDNIEKRTRIEQNYQTVEFAKKYGIVVKAFLMLGLPGETRETIAETEKFIQIARPDDFQLSIYYPYKGTKLRDMIDRGEDNFDLTFEGEGLGAYGQKGGSTEAVVRTGALSAQELLEHRDRIVREYRPESHTNKWATNQETDHFFDTHLKSKVEYDKQRPTA